MKICFIFAVLFAIVNVMEAKTELYNPGKKMIFMVIFTMLYTLLCWLNIKANITWQVSIFEACISLAGVLLKDIAFSIALIHMFRIAFRRKTVRKWHLALIEAVTILLNVSLTLIVAIYTYGKIDTFVILSIGLSVMYMIIMSGNPFSEKVAHERTEDVIELEAEKRKLELYYLNLQLNPHFLFNTLNVIYVQSRKEKARTTSEMIMTLSELLRYQLYEGADEKVMLKSEIKHIENYIELQKMRQTDLCIDYQKDGAVEGIMVYPFVTISLLENAFKYVDVNNSGEKFVKIFIGVDEKYVSFVVQNTKCDDAVASESTKPKSSGIGIENTKKRLDLLYAGKYMLDIKDVDKYFIVELKILLEND